MYLYPAGQSPRGVGTGTIPESGTCSSLSPRQARRQSSRSCLQIRLTSDGQVDASNRNPPSTDIRRMLRKIVAALVVLVMVVVSQKDGGRRRLRGTEDLSSGCYMDGCVLRACPASSYCLSHVKKDGDLAVQCATLPEVLVARLDKYTDHWQSVHWCSASDPGCNHDLVCPAVVS